MRKSKQQKEGMVEGFVIEGIPFVFDSIKLAQQARFPSKLSITKYEEEEEEEVI